MRIKGIKERTIITKEAKATGWSAEPEPKRRIMSERCRKGEEEC